MKKQLLIMFLFLLSACSYDKNPLVENAGYLEGEIDTYTSASKIRPVAGVKVTTLPATQEAVSNEDGRFYLDNIAAGEYIVKLQLKDHYDAFYPAEVLAGKTNEIAGTILPCDSKNLPPTAPHNPYPQSGGSVYDTALVIGWSCSDPDSNPIYYDVYFSEQNPPRKCIKYAQREKTNVKLSGLKTGTTYY